MGGRGIPRGSFWQNLVAEAGGPVFIEARRSSGGGSLVLAGDVAGRPKGRDEETSRVQSRVASCVVCVRD